MLNHQRVMTKIVGSFLDVIQTHEILQTSLFRFRNFAACFKSRYLHFSAITTFGPLPSKQGCWIFGNWSKSSALGGMDMYCKMIKKWMDHERKQPSILTTHDLSVLAGSLNSCVSGLLGSSIRRFIHHRP